MTTEQIRRATFVGALGVALLMLSSCFAVEPPIGGAAISADGDALNIAICNSVAMPSGRITYRQLSTENEWIDGWTFIAGGDIAAGTVLSSDPDVTPPFAQDVRHSIPLDAGTELLVTISSAAYASDGVDAGFVVPDGGLGTGRWLQQNGELTDVACP